jgi:ACR3 family arsenite efflux pump ArsB
MEAFMLNNNKIRLMTKLAVYENKEGKEDIRLSKYFKTDYVRYQVLKSIICATVGFTLILLLIFIYKSEYIIKNAITMNYKIIGSYVLGFYIMVVAVYGLASIVGYSIKYDQSRKKLSRYFKLLKRLSKFYNEETTES